MHDFTSARTYLVGVLALLVTVLFATACGGGLRPTLTDDRIGEAAAANTSPAAIPQADPALDLSEATTEFVQQSDAVGQEPVLVDGVEQLVVQVIEQFPHDEQAYTQGLELHNGAFIESTGRNGVSDLRRVVPQTGEVVQRVATPSDYFAEGVTVVGNDIIQLTWQSNTAYYWDANTFEMRKQVVIGGVGWGLCYDGARLIMTDGGTDLVFRDPLSFDETGRRTVTLDGEPVSQLNELECVGGVVWANIYPTDTIVRVDPATGEVTGVVDVSAIDPGVEDSIDTVLNGIAWDEATASFYLTGKYWPTMYRVNFVPAGTS